MSDSGRVENSAVAGQGGGGGTGGTGGGVISPGAIGGVPLDTYKSGATRSERKASYRLVPLEGLRRTAQRFELGRQVHGERGWMKCLVSESDAAEFAHGCYDHMMEHALKMANGLEPEDDHLAAIGWAQSVLCVIEERFSKSWTDLKA